MTSISITKLYWLLLPVLLLFTACASMPDPAFQNERNVPEVEPVMTVIPGFIPAKAAYDPLSERLFVLDQTSQKVSIFKGSSLMNVVGGFGFEKGNFQKLNDIEIDNDGSLLCLDGMAKVVKRFSTEGAYISEISLSGLALPTSFCVAPDQTMFVYDSATGEIVCLSALDHTEQYRFGRFQVQGLSSMSATRDYLLTYSAESNTSNLFSILGQQLDVYDGFWVMDTYKMLYTTKLIRYGRAPVSSYCWFAVQVYGHLDTLRHLKEHQGFVTLTRGDYIEVHRIVYGAAE
ncbi:MAG TPA: hypothetical protein PL124_04860 [Candidatus Cloacimonadota bacterium]|nr:hypothetical protein [Candidatus Cloacimonadota bacterium]HPS38725.1 hypothetical protein [Candidatus Cloacimonadota bacterium]